MDVTDPAARRLIVNADDFGFSPGVNAGVVRTHRDGIVTSASLMVRWPAAADAARLAADHPRLGVGLHVDLGEWVFRGGRWVRAYAVLEDDAAKDPAAVTAEVDRQLSAFRSLLGRDPTHVDSHQHAHREEPLRSAVLELGRRLRVPVRHFTADVRYCGDFYGQQGRGEPYPQGVTVENLCRVIRSLPPGTTELCCHPGAGTDHASVYAAERNLEVESLCGAAARAALADAGVILTNFAAFQRS